MMARAGRQRTAAVQLSRQRESSMQGARGQSTGGTLQETATYGNVRRMDITPRRQNSLALKSTLARLAQACRSRSSTRTPSRANSAP